MRWENLDFSRFQLCQHAFPLPFPSQLTHLEPLNTAAISSLPTLLAAWKEGRRLHPPSALLGLILAQQLWIPGAQFYQIKRWRAARLNPACSLKISFWRHQRPNVLSTGVSVAVVLLRHFRAQANDSAQSEGRGGGRNRISRIFMKHLLLWVRISARLILTRRLMSV